MQSSAKIIARLPMEPRFCISDINKMCRNGEIYGYKIKDKRFEPWTITPESFGLYLAYHPVLLSIFVNMDNIELQTIGQEVYDFYKNVCGSFTKNHLDTQLTFDDLSKIFDESVFETYKHFYPKCSRFRYFYQIYIKHQNKIPILRVIKYLCANPNVLRYLQYRYQSLLELENSTELSLIQYLLMLQSYYSYYGYLN